MMSLYMFIVFLIVFLFFYNFFSFLNSLLILESLSLLVFFMIIMYSFNFFSLKFSLFYFVFVVCESCLGLSILVKLIKNFGLSNFNSLNFLLF